MRALKTPCRVCGQVSWKPVISFGRTPLANSFVQARAPAKDEACYDLDVHFCAECGLLSLGTVVPKEDLYRHYIYISSDSQTISSHLAGLASRIIANYHLKHDDLVVEIGSNTGMFLRLFLNQGMSVLGVDPAENIAAVANANKVRTVAEFYSPEIVKKLRKELGPAKVILARHVLAHIDQVAPVVKAVASHLRQDGVFVVEVPYLLDLLKSNQFDTIYHEHLSYFSVATLSRLLEGNGLEVIDIERHPIHGGAIVAYAQRKDGPYRRAAAVDRLLEAEEREDLGRVETYAAFAARVEEVRNELKGIIGRLKADGLTIAGYGAPAKATTLLHYCGLGKDEISFCTDDTPAKQGLSMPGNRIPIRADRLSGDQYPDVFLLFAWNYAKEILSKEAAFLRRGGKFLVPIPKPRLVEDASEDKFHAGSIDGVQIRPIKVHRDLRGSLCETFRRDELPAGFLPVMGAHSWTNPGVCRGPHEHKEQSDLYVFAGPSDFRLVLWDNRPHSPTYMNREELRAGQSHPVSVFVPPGVVFGFENVGSVPGLAVTHPDRLYAGERRAGPLDEIRHELAAGSPFLLKAARGQA